jgi:hypothetical protein
MKQEHFIAVVKKTFGYPNVFFYNHLYHPSVFRNLFLKSGIIGHSYRKVRSAGRFAKFISTPLSDSGQKVNVYFFAP